ncbi:MAG: response regulator [Candidatus Staskawiczbacteria bacterium]|nr:response regulator [Candidatus Staskawiczbacteria bacterium]
MIKKVLVVEDDYFLRDLMAKHLSKAGYKVSQAIDGSKGLEAAKEEKPDVVLLDLLLPEMDGFEVLEKIKKDPAISNAIVIILSNLNQRADMEKALRLGAADYMVKANLTPEEIVQKIKGFDK